MHAIVGPHTVPMLKSSSGCLLAQIVLTLVPGSGLPQAAPYLSLHTLVLMEGR